VIIPLPRTLAQSGHLAEFEADRFVPGAVQLMIDGTPQSHVNLADPSDLFFEYVRRIGHVIDLVRPEREPITALHLGGGAFTLPRYVEATRPGSSQQVIELEGDLVDYVRESYPLPKRAKIRVRRGDARAVAAKLPAGLHGACDVIVVDVFAGARTPAHVTSTEFYRLLQPLLAPGGVIAINAADGPGLPFVRAQLATLAALFPAVAAVAEAQVLKGRRFGNVVIIAGQEDDAWDWLPRLLAGGPHPARLVEGKELRTLIGTAKPVTDQTATPSPEPARRIFEKR
jgi:spermidine synthase